MESHPHGPSAFTGFLKVGDVAEEERYRETNATDLEDGGGAGSSGGRALWVLGTAGKWVLLRPRGAQACQHLHAASVCLCKHCAHGALLEQPQDAGVHSNPGPLRGQSL